MGWGPGLLFMSLYFEMFVINCLYIHGCTLYSMVFMKWRIYGCFQK